MADSLNSAESLRNLPEVLRDMRSRGIRLWSENGELRYQAPKGALSRDELERLKASKERILELLDRAAAEASFEAPLKPSARSEYAPLSFTQLAHWRQSQLAIRPAVRQIAEASRVRGPLNVKALRSSIEAMVQRHSSLRTRIVTRTGEPVQQICLSIEWALEVNDLTSLPSACRDAEVRRLIEQLIMEPIDVARGPLFGARLLRLGTDDHVLVMAMEHIISDAYSMDILMRDLLTAYTQLLQDGLVNLPELPMQFVDYAVAQRNAPKSWIERHREYWDSHLAGCPRLRFPVDERAQAAGATGWGTIPLRIEALTRVELQRQCQLRGATLAMGLLTVYAAVLLRWCDVRDAVIQYQSDGRTTPQMQDLIGFFAGALQVRVQLREQDTFIDFLRRVESNYCEAFAHADHGFIETQIPHAEFVHGSGFNWIPHSNWSAKSKWGKGQDALTCEAIPFEHPLLTTFACDIEPGILLEDTGAEIVGGLHYPRSRLADVTMTRFGRNFIKFIDNFQRRPDQRVCEISLS